MADDFNLDTSVPNMQQQPTRPVGFGNAVLGGILARLTGTTSPLQAQALGLPQAQGLTPQQLQILASMPERQLQTQAYKQNIQNQQQDIPLKRADIKAQILERAAHARAYETIAKSGGKDSLEMLKLLEDLDKQTSGLPGLTAQSMDPEGFQEKKDQAEQIRKKLLNKHGIEIGGKKSKGGTAKPKTQVKYTKTATDGNGNKVGYNPQTKQWEPINGNATTPGGV